MSYIIQKKTKVKIKKLIVFLVTLYIIIVGLLYVFQEKIIFRPTVLSPDYAFKFEHPFEELFIENTDGAIINSILFKNEQPKGVILYFHGNMGDLTRWGKITEYFANKNYDILVMDYRTYGKSTGALSENALYNDAQLCYNYLKKYYKESDITVYGRSLGTGFATYVASKNNPKQLILETPYYSMVDEAKSMFPIVPVKMLLKYKIPAYQFIKTVKCNISILQGTKDKVVSHEAAFKLFNNSPKERTSFTSINGGSHNNLIDFKTYQKKIDEVLK